MKLIENLKKAHPWEWIVFAVAVALVCYGLGCLHGCAGVGQATNALQRHGTQAAVGTGIGAGAGLLAGATGWGVVVAALVGSAATIFSTPDCSEIAGGAPASHPMFSAMQWLTIAAVAYFLWLRREWLIRTFKGPSRVQSLWHALVAGARTRPKE